MDPTAENPEVIGTFGSPITQPAPTIVTSQPAETAVAGAQNNINQYNTAATTPTSPSTGTPPNSNGGTGTPTTPATPPTSTTTPSGTPNVNYGAYTDPSTGQTSYYAQTGTDAQGNPTYASDPTDPAIALNSGVGAVQIPTPGASSNSISSPYTPGANIDANGNITGTNVPAAVALGSSEDVASINARLNSLNDSLTASGQDSINMLNGLLSGSIPMSPAQQSVISNMTTQMNNLISLQTTANASYIGSVTEAQARNGDQSSAPANAMSMVHQAVSNANVQLSSIAAAQGLAIAQATDSFQNEDFQAMLSANENYQDTLKQSQSVLENLASTIQSSIESARTFNFNVQNQTFQNSMASATLSLQQKQDLFSNYISSGNLTLSQQTLALTKWEDYQQNSINAMSAGAALENANVAQETYESTFGQSNLWSNPFGGGSPVGSGTSQENSPTTSSAPKNSDGSTPQNLSGWKYDPQTGGFVDGNGNPITGDALTTLKNSLVGMQSFDDGVTFVDSTRLPSNPNLQTGITTTAADKNIPTLDSNDSSAINNAEQAKQELTQMYTYWIGTQPASALTGELGAAAQKLGSNMNPTPESIAANQAAYNSSKSALYQMLSSLSQSKRANGGEYEVGTEAAPTANNAYGFNTLQATGQAEFGAINANINALIGGVLPQVTIQSDPVFSTGDDFLNQLAPISAGSTSQTSSSASPLNIMAPASQ